MTSKSDILAGRFTKEFSSKRAAVAQAKDLRRYGVTAKVYFRSTVCTVPGRGITSFASYIVKVSA